MNLYIDTNAYLTFYHLTNQELEELKKLETLLNTGVVFLHLPEHTLDEFYRNREVKIADSIKRFSDQKIGKEFPRIFKDYEEYGLIRQAIDNYEKYKSQILEKVTKDAIERKLAADAIISSLFEKAIVYETTKEIFHFAKTRFDLGKPPGKNKSYGDAINWESLLHNVPANKDLYFISDDKDFYSEIDSTLFNSYLLDEWKSKKEGTLKYYRRLSEFFKENFPNIRLASDYEKEIFINELANSRNFSSSRYTLYQLSKFQDFSEQQIISFVNACLNNSQIKWIKDDKDLKEIISGIVSFNKEKIETNLLNEFLIEYQYPENLLWALIDGSSNVRRE